MIFTGRVHGKSCIASLIQPGNALFSLVRASSREHPCRSMVCGAIFVRVNDLNVLYKYSSCPTSTGKNVLPAFPLTSERHWSTDWGVFVFAFAIFSFGLFFCIARSLSRCLCCLNNSVASSKTRVRSLEWLILSERGFEYFRLLLLLLLLLRPLSNFFGLAEADPKSFEAVKTWSSLALRLAAFFLRRLSLFFSLRERLSFCFETKLSLTYLSLSSGTTTWFPSSSCNRTSYCEGISRWEYHSYRCYIDL